MNSLRGRIETGVVVVAVLGAALTGYVYFESVYAPCVSPITYTIGTLDPRFGVSQKDFLSAIQQAQTIWSSAAGKTLFTYDPKGELAINLVYDTRQANTQKTAVLQNDISQTKDSAAVVKQQYTSLKEAYSADQATYLSLLSAYNDRLDAYNQEVSYWNQRGGAPKEEFQKLAAEKSSLQQEAASLDEKRLAVNAEAKQINSLIDSYNILASHVNANVAVVNQNVGKEFDEGEFISDSQGIRINIYQFQNRDKLVRVLAHELGHALGLDHNTNPASIMYYLNQSTNLLPSADDIAALKKLCNLK